MRIFAVVSSFEAVAKLIIAITIGYYSGEKLELYALLLSLVSLFVLLTYGILCFYYFKNSRLGYWKWNSKLLKELLVFTFLHAFQTYAYTCELISRFGVIINVGLGVNI